MRTSNKVVKPATARVLPYSCSGLQIVACSYGLRSRLGLAARRSFARWPFCWGIFEPEDTAFTESAPGDWYLPVGAMWGGGNPSWYGYMITFTPVATAPQQLGVTAVIDCYSRAQAATPAAAAALLHSVTVQIADSTKVARFVSVNCTRLDGRLMICGDALGPLAPAPPLPGVGLRVRGPTSATFTVTGLLMAYGDHRTEEVLLPILGSDLQEGD